MVPLFTREKETKERRKCGRKAWKEQRMKQRVEWEEGQGGSKFAPAAHEDRHPY